MIHIKLFYIQKGKHDSIFYSIIVYNSKTMKTVKMEMIVERRDRLIKLLIVTELFCVPRC